MLESLLEGIHVPDRASNFTWCGPSLLSEVSLSGKLDADYRGFGTRWGVCRAFRQAGAARDYCPLLNVMRDQLDRFGEIDNTARLLLGVSGSDHRNRHQSRGSAHRTACGRRMPKTV